MRMTIEQVNADLTVVGQKLTLTVLGGSITATGDPVGTAAALDAQHLLDFEHTKIADIDGKEEVGVAAAADTAHVVSDHSNDTGNVNRANSVVSFVNATRTFTISPLSGAFTIKHKGVDFVISVPQSVVIPNTVGTHFIYFVDGVLTTSTEPWDINGDRVFVHTINWNGTIGAPGEERHGLRDLAWHDNHHHTVGTMYQSGLDLIYPNQANDLLLSFGSGTLFDEDLQLTLPPSTRCRLWREVSAGQLSFVNGQDNDGTHDFPVFWNPSTTQVQYNRLSDYSLQDVANNGYVCYFYYGSNDTEIPIYVLAPTLTAPFNTSNDARRSPPVASFSPELKLLYRVIFNGSGSFVEAEDFRSSSALPGGGTASTTAGAVSLTPSAGLSSTTVQSGIDVLASRVSFDAVSGILNITNGADVVFSIETAVEVITTESGLDILLEDSSELLL